MNLFDHIIAAPDEAVAHTLLAGVTYRGHLISQPELDEAGNPTGVYLWSQAIPVRAIIAAAVWDNSDPEAPVISEPEITVPGFFVLVPQSQLNTALRDLPAAACQIIVDRNQASPTRPLHEYANYISPSFDEALLSRDADGRIVSIAITISPAPGGTSYPLGHEQ